MIKSTVGELMNDNRYARFGALLRELRLKAGIAHQANLATLLVTSQQTVSRWEAGESRPRAKQLPLLAEVLRTNSMELLEAAGYAQKNTIMSFDRPLPIDALSPEGFERFCVYFLDALYPEAEVHAAGSQGHTQEGIDIDVLFPNRTRYTFQCKRVEEFGPRKVHVAVAAHTIRAKKKFLLLKAARSHECRQELRIVSQSTFAIGSSLPSRESFRTSEMLLRTHLAA